MLAACDGTSSHPTDQSDPTDPTDQSDIIDTGEEQ